MFNSDFATIGTLINETGGLISGVSDTGINNLFGASITTLTNNGSISGAVYGIVNDDFIGTLANTGGISGRIGNGIFNDQGTIFTLSQSGGGTITGGTIGVLNYDGGTIATLTNGLAGGGITADKIFGTTTGVSNHGGTIGTLTNNGTIAGGTYGITNSLYEYSVELAVAFAAPTANQTQGTIATLTNTGSIAGGSTGIYNNGGYIGTLTNSATIIGGNEAGINNDPSGTIDTLSNTALINGGFSGIHNNGIIGTLINSGTITGVDFGINGAGTIAQISNSGTIVGTDGAGVYMDFGTFTNQTGGVISGTEGAEFANSGSTLVNAGSIISTQNLDAILFSSFGSDVLILTTGSLIDGIIYGNGGPDNQITLEGTGNLDNTITNFGAGSALDVVSGADWTASGAWAIPSVTNDGTFAPGETANGAIGSTLFLTGNFTQNADGTLLVAVAPEEGTFTTSDFVITGSASLNGAVDFTFAPGTYEAGSHSFLSATNVTGAFSSAHYTGTPSGLTASVTYPDVTDPLLVLTGSGTGIVNAGTTTVSTITTPPIITPPVITPPVTTPPTFVVRPPDTGIFADELQSSANRAQSSNAALLGKAAEGEAAAAAVCGAEAGVTPAQTTPDKITGVEKLTNAVADAFCGAGGWIQASGTAMNVEGEGATQGYNADTAGFLAGIDAPVNNAGTRLGLAVGYDETFLADSAGGKGQVDTFRAGIFGSQAAGPFMLAGDFLYGHTSTNTQRVTGIGYAKSSADGNIFSGALQADTLVHLGALNLVPQAGLRIAGVSGNSFTESGVLPAFALTGNSGFYTSVQPFVNVDVSKVFLTQSNIAITPDASFGYAYEAGDIGHALIVTSRDGTHFASDYLKLDPNIADLSAGISAGAGKWSFYARYSAELTGNWTSQTGEAGLRLRF